MGGIHYGEVVILSINRVMKRLRGKRPSVSQILLVRHKFGVGERGRYFLSLDLRVFLPDSVSGGGSEGRSIILT